MTDRHDREDALNQFWNALAGAELNATEADLTPEEIEVVHRLQRAGTAPLAGLSAEAAWPRVLARIEPNRVTKENPMTQTTAAPISTPIVLPNGRAAGHVSSSPGFAPARGPGRWAWGHLATAALLVLTIATALVAFGPRGPGSSPPAGNHQMGAVTTAASPVAQPALAEFVGEISLDPDGTDESGAGSGVAIAADGTLYVIDSRNDQIRVFDREGSPVATWGESGEGPGQFKFRAMGFFYGDLAIGPDGDIYVMDTANSRVQVFSPDGTYLREWGEPGSEEGQFSVPSGIGIDDAGRVYVTETGNKRLQIFDSEGQFLDFWEPTEAEGGPFMDPADVAIDAAGIVSVTDYDSNRIFRFDAEGSVIERLGIERQYRAGEAKQPEYLSQPWGATLDAQGNLYVAEFGGGRVQVFAPDGAPRGVIEGVATEPGQASIALIYLAVSSDGLLYISDHGKDRVQVFRLLPPLVSTPATLELE